jgi:hypothetical protein
MGKAVKLEVSGIKETQIFLNKKEGKVKTQEAKGIKDATLFMQGEVKASIAGRKAEPTSVDTGRFLNSINVAFGKDDGVVFTELDYAKFLEFGTSRLNARKHFRNSKARNQNKATAIVRDAIKKI